MPKILVTAEMKDIAGGGHLENLAVEQKKRCLTGAQDEYFACFLDRALPDI